MNHKATQRSVAFTAVLLAAAGVLWAAVPAVLVFAVPRYERAFRDQGLRLPAPTEWALAAGRWAGNYWYVLPLFGLLVLPVIVLLSWLVRHRVAGALWAWIWFGALLGVPLLLQLGVWFALLLP